MYMHVYCMQPVRMDNSGWLVESHTTRVEWRSAMLEPGALSVMTLGTQLMLVWPVYSLASLEVTHKNEYELSLNISKKH